MFVLDDVKDFRASRCRPVADTQIAEAKHKEL
jgi:hypothetical protein